MKKIEDINDEEISLLVAHYEKNIDSIQKEIEILTSKLLLYKDRINQLTAPDLFLDVLREKYDVEWTLSDKCAYVLKKHNDIANTRKIAELITKEEGKLSIIATKYLADLVSNIGATLKQKVDRKLVFARMEENGEFYYGLIEWFFSDGNLKPEFTYKRKLPFGNSAPSAINSSLEHKKLLKYREDQSA